MFTCNDLAGTIRPREFLDHRRPTRGVIVGSACMGFDVADAFTKRGIEVAVLGRSKYVLESFESESCERVKEVLQGHDVVIKRNCEVTQIIASTTENALNVHHAPRSESAGVVLPATGMSPRAQLAASARIVIGPTSAIAVDERMRTSLNGIYAAGDCAGTRNLVTGKPAYFPLGTTANKLGRVAGESAAGGHARFDGITGRLATKVLELEIARTGFGSTEARTCRFDADSVTIHSTSRAEYLSGRPIAAKLLWHRASGRLLRFQLAGEDGVAKRIDAAVALHARTGIEDIAHLDLSYAPPFAPVWEALRTAAGEAMKKSRHG